MSFGPFGALAGGRELAGGAVGAAAGGADGTEAAGVPCFGAGAEAVGAEAGGAAGVEEAELPSPSDGLGRFFQ